MSIKNTIRHKAPIKTIITTVAAICALAMVVLLAGCTAPMGAQSEQDGEDKPITNSEYMAEVNQVIEELSERLQSFNDAVSRQDPITMRTQADNAFATLDKLAAIEAPEDIKDLREQYIKGCDQLKDALNSYIDLYSEMSAAKAEAASSRYNDPFDPSRYSEQIEQIQVAYDEGIKTLEDADSSAKDR